MEVFGRSVDSLSYQSDMLLSYHEHKNFVILTSLYQKIWCVGNTAIGVS
jgi:hypothetical protein